jgi:hypothetical protein
MRVHSWLPLPSFDEEATAGGRYLGAVQGGRVRRTYRTLSRAARPGDQRFSGQRGRRRHRSVFSADDSRYAPIFGSNTVFRSAKPPEAASQRTLTTRPAASRPKCSSLLVTTNSKDATAAGTAEPSSAEPTEEIEMQKRREPPTQFMVQYIDDCLDLVITASYASHIRALKRFLIASHAEKMWINTKAVFATKCVSTASFRCTMQQSRPRRQALASWSGQHCQRMGAQHSRRLRTSKCKCAYL